MEEGKYLTLRNAKVDMYKGSMRLAVNQWGVIEKAPEGTKFEVKVASQPTLGTMLRCLCRLHLQTQHACLHASHAAPAVLFSTLRSWRMRELPSWSSLQALVRTYESLLHGQTGIGISQAIAC